MPQGRSHGFWIGGGVFSDLIWCIEAPLGSYIPGPSPSLARGAGWPCSASILRGAAWARGSSHPAKAGRVNLLSSCMRVSTVKYSLTFWWISGVNFEVNCKVNVEVNLKVNFKWIFGGLKVLRFDSETRLPNIHAKFTWKFNSKFTPVNFGIHYEIHPSNLGLVR